MSRRARKPRSVWKRWRRWCSGVKVLRFRLDPALRWRDTQLRLEQERVAQIAARMTAIQAEMVATHGELRAGSAALPAAGSAAFGSWAAYVDRCRRRILSLEEQSRLAKQALALQTQKVVVAHQKLRVIENLKHDARVEWTRELERETDVFAEEAFLARVSRNARRDV
jgi:hypothetical protein